MADEQQERGEGVSRQLGDESAPSDTDREGQVGPTGGGGAEQAPSGVGGSVSHSGEDVEEEQGKERGREDTGTQGPTDRPTGTSGPDDMTGI